MSCPQAIQMFKQLIQTLALSIRKSPHSLPLATPRRKDRRTVMYYDVCESITRGRASTYIGPYPVLLEARKKTNSFRTAHLGGARAIRRKAVQIYCSTASKFNATDSEISATDSRGRMSVALLQCNDSLLRLCDSISCASVAEPCKQDRLV